MIALIKGKSMNTGKARAIFLQLGEDKYSLEDKLVAIDVILNFATDNSIRKQDYKAALRWLYDAAVEKGEQEQK